jgi:hypothetical protein
LNSLTASYGKLIGERDKKKENLAKEKGEKMKNKKTIKKTKNKENEKQRKRIKGKNKRLNEQLLQTIQNEYFTSKFLNINFLFWCHG